MYIIFIIYAVIKNNEKIIYIYSYSFSFFLFVNIN